MVLLPKKTGVLLRFNDRGSVLLTIHHFLILLSPTFETHSYASQIRINNDWKLEGKTSESADPGI